MVKSVLFQVRRELKQYKLLREVAQLGRRVRRWHRIIPNYIKRLGLIEGLRAMSASTFAMSDVYVKVKGITHPVRIRPRTSDKYVFEQIFVEEDYNVECERQPRWIIDGGANVGYASLYFANRYPSAQVLAIEPSEANFHELQNNIALYPKIIAIKAALWSKHGSVAVDDSRESWSCSVAESTQETPQSVNAITIRDCFELLAADQIDILKLDVEGAEKEISSANVEWLDRTRLMIVELHDRHLAGCSVALERALEGRSFKRSERGENLILTPAHS